MKPNFAKFILGLAGLSLFMSSFAQAQTKLTIGSVAWIGFAGFIIAEEQGLYKTHGVEARLHTFPDNSTMAKEFAKGSVDAALLTYEQVIEGIANGGQWRVVAVADYSNGGDAIVARHDLTSLEQLKGKKVGLDVGSPSAILLDYAMLQGKLNLGDVERVNMTPDAVPAEMENARLDAGVTYEPNISALTQAGGGKKFHVLYSSKDAPGLITDVLVFKQDYLEQHPDTVKAVIKAYRDALKVLREQPDEAARVLSPVFGISRSEVAEQLTGVHIPTLEEMLPSFAESTDINSFYESGKVISQVLQTSGRIKSIPATADTLDASFIKAVAAGE